MFRTSTSRDAQAKRFFHIVVISINLAAGLGGSPAEAALRDPSAAPPRIHNLMDSKALKYFQRRVARQARALPRSFLVEAPGATRQISLTFDDGPHPRYTKRILKALANHGIKATFFLVGSRVRKYPTLARAIVRGGHAVGGHGYDHVFMHRLRDRKQFSSQIARTQRSFEEVVGYRPSIFRPPYGMISNRQVAQLAHRGIATINWSVDSFDWRASHNRAKQICDTVTRNAHDGAVVLMHSSAGSRGETVRALPCIIAKLRARGFSFRTVPAILRIAARLPAHPLRLAMAR